VVNKAIYELNELKKDQGDESDVTIVWAVLDLEHEKLHRQRAEEAKNLAKPRGVNVALSDPCYEVWTLLHLEDTGKRFETCSKVLDRVKKVWKETFDQALGPKAQADFSKIIHLRHGAAARAKRHWEKEKRSGTEVYKIIEDIESIVQRVGTKAKDSGKNQVTG